MELQGAVKAAKNAALEGGAEPQPRPSSGFYVLQQQTNPLDTANEAATDASFVSEKKKKKNPKSC